MIDYGPWWARRDLVWKVIVLILFAGASIRITESFRGLIWGTNYPVGAADVAGRFDEVHRWFGGVPVYGARETKRRGDYPPGSYALLWPLVGWLSFNQARWLWAITAALAVAVLSYFFACPGTPRSVWERAYLVLLFLASYAVCGTILLGNLGIHCLACVVAGTALLMRGSPGRMRELLAAGLFLFALVKPTFSVPFLCAAILVSRRWSVLFYVVAAYLGICAVAASYQGESLFVLLQQWQNQTQTATAVLDGQGNVHFWIANVAAWMNWSSPVRFYGVASLIVLLAFALWANRYRDANFWIVLGVAALTASLWAHHRAHDDVMLQLPVVALYQVAICTAPPRQRSVAWCLLAVLSIILIIPLWRLSELPPDFLFCVKAMLTVLSLCILVFLLHNAHYLARDDTTRNGRYICCPDNAS